MSERRLFLTGKLAEKNLQRVLESMQPMAFEPVVQQLGINVAGLMTADMIRRRLDMPDGIDRVIVPGRCRGDLDALSQHYGILVERGPEELKDLPEFFGQRETPPDLSRYDIKIFAEIVDAPDLDVETVLQRAQAYRDQGADVIDIGCLPNTPFPHLAETVQALRDADIVYQSVRVLGSPRDLRHELRETRDWRKFSDRFQEHLNGQTEALSELIEYAYGEPTCLMCFEHDSAMCHRSIVAERAVMLANNGLTVRHL